MTLLSLINYIKTIGEHHGQLKTIFYGNTWDFLDNGDNQYCAMMFNVDTGNVQGNMLVFNLDLFIIDRMLQDMSNVEEVKSDCLQIGLDILGKFKLNQEIRMSDSPTFDMLEENTPDYLAGVKFSLQIFTPYVYDICNIPYK